MSALPNASLPRRLGSLLYDALAFVALGLLASAIFTSLSGAVTTAVQRTEFQLFSGSLIAAYYLWCWVRGGQTLAMRTWRIRLLREDGAPVGFGVALLRLVLAAASLSMLGLGVWWALVDRDGRFLHDRLARTRLVVLPR